MRVIKENKCPAPYNITSPLWRHDAVITVTVFDASALSPPGLSHTSSTFYLPSEAALINGGICIRFELSPNCSPYFAFTEGFGFGTI